MERLFRSLRYIRIDPGLDRAKMTSETLRLVAANADRLASGVQYRLGHWVTRGGSPFAGAADAEGPATVFMFLDLVDTAATARKHETGVRLSVTTTRRNPPECIETRAKITSKMNQLLAELDAGSRDSLSLMLDTDGNVAENSVANFLLSAKVWSGRHRNAIFLKG